MNGSTYTEGSQEPVFQMLVQIRRVLGRTPVQQSFLGQTATHGTLEGRRIGKPERGPGRGVEEAERHVLLEGCPRRSLVPILSRALALPGLGCRCPQKISITRNTYASERTCRHRTNPQRDSHNVVFHVETPQVAGGGRKSTVRGTHYLSVSPTQAPETDLFHTFWPLTSRPPGSRGAKPLSAYLAR